MTRAPDPAAAQGGFVLPSVLVVVGMVTLVFLISIDALDSLAKETARVTGHTHAQAAALNLEAQATWFAATQPLSSTAILATTGGFRPALQPIVLDGRPYATAAGPLIALQDEAGLVNLDTLPQSALPGLFTALGVAPGQRAAMVDRFGDYLDADDLKRVEGAEADDYLRAGLPPPPNGPLRRKDQALGVMSWKQAVTSQAWLSARDALTADPSTISMNVNTAPATALQVLFGFSPAQARAAISRRASAPFTGLEDLGRAAGVALVGDSERVYTFPNGRFAVKISDPAAGWVFRSRILLSPDDAERPFWVVEQRVSAMTPAEKANSPAHAPNLPDPAA
jgi:type II secretory pathway component PulK